MARMYEMNLIIRLQDRASARMRRISGDMSALSRHAQAQNKLVQMSAASTKQRIVQQKALNDLEARAGGSKSMANLAQQLTLEAQVMDRRKAAARFGNSTSSAAISAQKKLEASEWRLEALKTKTLEEQHAITAAIEESAAAEAALNAEIARQAPLIARQAQAARTYNRGRAIAHGGSLAFMTGAVTTGLAGFAANAYANFDVQARKAATQVGDTNLGIIDSMKQTTEIAKEQEQVLLGLAKQYPATAEEMAQAQYNIYSSMDLGDSVGERMANGLKVLEAANKAAVGGQVDLATATDTLITVFNDFDPNISRINTNMAQLFAIVRFMRGGFEELSAGMNKLAPAAKLAHYSLLDVGAAFSVITQAIPSAAQASTAEARLIDLFGRPEFINGMQKYGQALGKTNDQFSVLNKVTGQLLPIDKIIGNILKIDPSLAAGGPKLFNFVKQITELGSDTGKGGYRGTIQMTRALAILITEHQKHLKILKESRQDTIEYNKSVQILSQSAGVKWKIAMNQLRVAWIQFGQAAMPILLKVLETFSKVLDKFNGMGGGTRKVIGSIVVISGLLLTMGGLFASAFGGITMLVATKRIRDLEKALYATRDAEVAMTTASGPARAGILGFGKAALKAAGWVGLVVLAIDTLKGGFDEFSRQDVKGNKIQKTLRGWASQFESANQAVAGLFGVDVKPMYESFFNKLSFAFGKATPKVKEAHKAVADSAVLKGSVVTKSANDTLEAVLKANQAHVASEKKMAAWEKNLAKERTRARQAALKEQKSDIDSAAKNLLAKYKELEAANKAAAGSLLEGPIAGGPILSAFADINKTLMGFGIKPIKVPVEFLMQDAQAQLANFDMWRGALSKLSKKVPKEMLDELRAAGIDKLPEILSLADAGPQFLKQYVNVWKDTKSARDAATKADMDSSLKLWLSYGKDVAWQIVNGLVDSGAEAKLYEGFTKTITTTFAGQLTANMNKAVEEAIANWKEANPPPKVAPGATAAQVTTADTAAKTYLTQQAYLENMQSHGWAIRNPNLMRSAQAPAGDWQWAFNKNNPGNLGPPAPVSTKRPTGLKGPGASRKMYGYTDGRAPTSQTTVHHETNLNVDVSNPTGKAIADAIKPVIFGLRHKPT